VTGLVLYSSNEPGELSQRQCHGNSTVYPYTSSFAETITVIMLLLLLMMVMTADVWFRCRLLPRVSRCATWRCSSRSSTTATTTSSSGSDTLARVGSMKHAARYSVSSSLSACLSVSRFQGLYGVRRILQSLGTIQKLELPVLDSAGIRLWSWKVVWRILRGHGILLRLIVICPLARYKYYTCSRPISVFKTPQASVIWSITPGMFISFWLILSMK